MIPITTEQLLDTLNWRYATKAFDPAKPIPDATWAALEQALVLSPSSYGLQPWRFIDVRDPALRAKLREHSWGQGQVTDAAHLVVFAARTDLVQADIDKFVARIAEVRGQPREAIEPYRQMMSNNLLNAERAPKNAAWASRQTYIAMGQLMTAAALLGVDTCPIEGLDPAKYDEILGTRAEGYAVFAAVALGYRAAGDKYAGIKKVRFAVPDVVKVA